MNEDIARRSTLSPILSSVAFSPLSSTVQVQVAARTHTGLARASNEDHFLVMRMGRDQETLLTSLARNDLPARFSESGYALLVADGLGAGGAGSVASRVAISTMAHVLLHFGKWNLRIDPETAEEIFDRAEWFYARADDAIRQRAGSNPLLKGMTAALTAAYSAGDDLFVTHVGHSRAYLYRGGSLSQLTRDHTLKQHLADANRPTSVERRAQDLRHILTDAVGAPGGHPLVEVEKFRLLNGDSVLLCTNGLTDMITDDDIAEALALRRSPDEQCEILIERAIRAGGADNVTVVIAQYEIPNC
jgi:PPM family protein phosphatase